MAAPKRKFQQTYVREWRKHRGLTLEKVADRMDMTPGHISLLERGQRGYTQETLEAVAAALQTDVASLLIRDPTDPRPPGQSGTRRSPPSAANSWSLPRLSLGPPTEAT